MNPLPFQRHLVRGVLLCFSLALGASAAHASSSFAGRLLKADGSPAANYLVSVLGRPGSVLCDADGAFVFDPAPEPPFSLVATSPDGLSSAPIEILALPGDRLEVRLPDVIRDSLTVIAGIAPTLEALPATASLVVTREELEQRAPRKLVQALESVAGASRLDGGPDGVPVLRGLARGRTLILLDGARVSAERRAGPSATFIDPASLGSVEVLRGPGSVQYGSDAFGGVINAVTRDPDSDGFQVSFNLEGSTGGLNERGAYVAAAGPVGKLGTLLLEVHGREGDEAEAGGGGEIFNSDYASSGGAFRLIRDVGPGRLRVGVGVDRGEDIGKPSSDSRQIRSYYPTEDSDRFTASWLGAPGGGWESVEAAIFYGRYRLVLDRDRFPTATSNRRIDRSDVESDDASLRLVGSRGWAGGQLQMGLDASSRFNLSALTGRVDFAADASTITRSTTTVSIDDAQQRASGLFATWNRSLGTEFTLGLGARGDHIEVKNTGGFFGDRDETHDALSGNVSLTWQFLAHTSGTLQVARGFRAPTLSDRYFRGPSGRGFVTGNPDLDPETSRQVDLALRWGKGRTAVAVYAYRYEIDDLVERFRVGDNFEFRNRGQATIEGFEIEAQGAYGRHWSGDMGLAIANGETDGGATVDDIAPPNGWVTARWSYEQGYVFARVTTYLEHDDPGPTEDARPGFTLYDVGAGYRFNDQLEIRAIVRNAGDKRYLSAADEIADFGFGRALTVGLSGTF